MLPHSDVGFYDKTIILKSKVFLVLCRKSRQQYVALSDITDGINAATPPPWETRMIFSTSERHVRSHRS